MEVRMADVSNLNRKTEILRKLNELYETEVGYAFNAETGSIFVRTAKIKNCRTEKELDIFSFIQDFNALEGTPEFEKHNSNQKSILIKGDPGLGKTVLAKRVLQSSLQKVNEEILQNKADDFLPIYIDLATCTNETVNKEELNLNFIICNKLKLIGINKEEINRWRILVLVDGYDEWNSVLNYRNLELTKFCIITFSQKGPLPQTILEREYLFSPNISVTVYTEYELVHFSTPEIKEYIKQYCKAQRKDLVDRWEISKYMEWLDSILDLRELCETPLLLSIIIPNLANILQKYSDEPDKIRQICSTQTGIFDEFTQQCFEHQFRAIKNKKFYFIDLYQFQAYCGIYYQNLVMQSVDSQDFLRKRLWTEKETLNPLLLEPSGSHYDLISNWNEKKPHLTDESFVKLIRRGCLLTFSNGQYSFFHRSIAEYFAAKEISENMLWRYNAHIRAEGFEDIKLETKIFNSNSSLLKPLADRSKSDKGFEDLLLTIVQTSAHCPGLGELSSRALTILNSANFNFSNLNFQDIVAPFANMTQSLCSKTDFRRANLKGANFAQAYITGARFQGANLLRAKFGEEFERRAAGRNLCCYVTPSNYAHLIFMYSEIAKCYKNWRGVEKINRNDKVFIEITNFDTGKSLRKIYLGKFSFGLAEYQICQNKYLVTWPYSNNWFRPGDFKKIKIWKLSAGKEHQTVYLDKLFICPPGMEFSIYSDVLRIDERGRWAAIIVINDKLVTEGLLITAFIFQTEGMCQQVFVPVLENVKIDSFQFAPTKDVLILITSVQISILTLTLVNSTVVVSNEYILEHSHSSFLSFDFNSKFVTWRSHLHGSTWRSLNLLDIDSKEVKKFEVQSNTRVVSVSFNFDSTLLAVSDNLGSIFIFSIKDSKLVQTISGDLNGPVSLCFHKEIDNNTLACGMGGTTKFYQVTSGSKSPILKHQDSAKTSDGNFGYLTSSFDGHYVASLNFENKNENGVWNESEKRKLTLNIWNNIEGNSFNRKPLSVNVGTFLGPGIAFHFSSCNNYILLLGTLMKDVSQSSGLNSDSEDCLLYLGYVLEPVALIYNICGQLISKQTIEHSTWKGIKSLNYRSALFFEFEESSTTYNLATAMWDGCIQLWKFNNHKEPECENFFVKDIVLIMPEDRTDEYRTYKYIDHLNLCPEELKSKILAPEHYWVHIAGLTFSSCGKWVLSITISNELFVWNITSLPKNHFPTFNIKVDTDSRAMSLAFDSKRLNCYFVSPGDFHIFSFTRFNTYNKIFKRCKVISTNKSLKLVSGIMYQPFNWLICGDRYGKLRIWKNNVIIFQLPFWFRIFSLAVTKVNENKINILVGGYYNNLLSVSVNCDLEWKIVHVFSFNNIKLVADNCSISQCLQLSGWNRQLLSEFGATGEPAPPNQKYYSFQELFREMPGTVSQNALPSVFKTVSSKGQDIFTDDDLWTVSVVSKTPKILFFKLLKFFVGYQHLFLVLEGTINKKKFAIRADLRADGNNVFYTLKYYESLAEFNKDISNCAGMQWEITSKYGKKLIQNIRKDQQIIWKYDLLQHNCVTWCNHQLRQVGVPSTYQQLIFNFSKASRQNICMLFLSVLIVSVSFILTCLF